MFEPCLKQRPFVEQSQDPEDVRLVFETGHVADFSAVQADGR
jgi:hypothetical protein